MLKYTKIIDIIILSMVPERHMFKLLQCDLFFAIKKKGGVGYLLSLSLPQRQTKIKNHTLLFKRTPPYFYLTTSNPHPRLS